MPAVNRTIESVSGFFIAIYKPVNMTSRQVVNHFQKIAGRKFKVGHVGTLDPFAEGMLLLAFGKATKLADHVHRLCSKTYLAQGSFSNSTFSGDLTGDTNLFSSIELLNELNSEKIQHVGNSFIGEYWQRPHAFSACKKDGVPLYAYARDGVYIEKDPVLRHIYTLAILQWDCPHVTYRVKVGSGVYIRVLMEDLATKLSCYAHLIRLQRESIGELLVKDCLMPENWPNSYDEFCVRLKDYALAPDMVIPLPSIQLSAFDSKLVNNGQTIERDYFAPAHVPENLGQSTLGWAWAMDENARLIGLASLQDEKHLKIAVHISK